MPLFNPKTIEKAVAAARFEPSQEQLAAAAAWADGLRSGKLQAIKETALYGDFRQRILKELLGYSSVTDGDEFSAAENEPIGSGSVEFALGQFSAEQRQVLAPLELKDASTDLDAIMPGRHKTPVQQAWDYAADAKGAQWVLVSNYAELRLYAFGYGRDVYESWRLEQLDDPTELARFHMLLSADNLVNGETQRLLQASEREDKDITDKLYDDYRKLRTNLIQTIADQNRSISGEEAIGHAQRILDRILFVAFAEDQALLPRGTLKRVAKEHMGTLFDPHRAILTQNLYGVDVNAESVEITKLSLWLRTAKRGEALQSLRANIRTGNSLIEDSDYHFRAFAWREAFPEIVEQGGFHIVIGNPPYVRMELIKPFKPYLEKRYEVVSDRADLYCYFYELGFRLLREGGKLGFISSSSFFRTGSGAPLRRYLAEKARLESVVDFGDLQLFEGVTTYPAIVTMAKTRSSSGCSIQKSVGSISQVFHQQFGAVSMRCECSTWRPPPFPMRPKKKRARSLNWQKVPRAMRKKDTITSKPSAAASPICARRTGSRSSPPS